MYNEEYKSKSNEPKHTGLECKYCGTGCPECSGDNNRIIVNETW